MPVAEPLRSAYSMYSKRKENKRVEELDELWTSLGTKTFDGFHDKNSHVKGQFNLFARLKKNMQTELATEHYAQCNTKS